MTHSFGYCLIIEKDPRPALYKSMCIEGNLAILAPLGIMVSQRGEEQQQALNKKRELSLDYHSSSSRRRLL